MPPYLPACPIRDCSGQHSRARTENSSSGAALPGGQGPQVRLLPRMPHDHSWLSRPAFGWRQEPRPAVNVPCPSIQFSTNELRADGRIRTDVPLTGLQLEAAPLRATTPSYPAALWCSTTELHPLPGLMTSLGSPRVISPQVFVPRLRFANPYVGQRHLAYPVPAWRRGDSHPHLRGYEPRALLLSYSAVPRLLVVVGRVRIELTAAGSQNRSPTLRHPPEVPGQGARLQHPSDRFRASRPDTNHTTHVDDVCQLLPHQQHCPARRPGEAPPPWAP